MSKYWSVLHLKITEKNITWYVLSKISGVPESSITNARLTDRPLNWHNTCKIAIALEISLDELNEYK